MAPHTPHRSDAPRGTRGAPRNSVVTPRLVLASSSPRRRALLGYLVTEFDVIPSGADERLPPGPLLEAVARVAEVKGRAVAERLEVGIVLSADTVVVIDGDVLGKPAGAADAAAMLHRLRGRAHDVLTGVAVVDAASGRIWRATEVTRVVMARYADALIERYVASGSPLDKAGGYAIQDLDGALVDAVVGSYTNVIGLPLSLTGSLLTAAGVRISGVADRG